MKLITENDTKVGIIRESIDENGERSLFIEGIFAQAEKPNRNNRIYPKEVLEKAIGRYTEDYVLKNRALGELLHPASSTPNPERACILIKDLAWSGNDVYGKAKVLKTPQGEIVRSLISDGVQLGVSTRGVGSLNEKKDVSIVEDDYTITAIDVVSNPSGIDCWVNGIYESVGINNQNLDRWVNGILVNSEFYIENGVIKESSIEEYQKHIKSGTMKNLRFDFIDFVNKIKI